MQTPNENPVSLKELRQVGCGFGVLFCLIGGMLLWKGKDWGTVLVLFGPVIVLAFWFDLPGIRQFFKVWMAFALRMSRVMTAVLLSLLFFLVLTPTSLLARLFGQQFVEKKIDKTRLSYWRPCTGKDDPARCEKQS